MSALNGKENHNYTHGGQKNWPREYKSWSHMKSRCFCKTNHKYPSYGGRGITVCDEWKDDFMRFLYDMGPKPLPKDSIDRIDNEGNYEPSNCRWASATEQANNRRTSRMLTYKGETKTMAQWSKERGMTSHVLAARLDVSGMSIEDAIETPVKSPKRGPITFNGVTKSILQWSKDLGFSRNTVHERLRKGWSIEKTLTHKVRV